MNNPIDLRPLAGKRYRLAHDAAADHEPGGRNNPWLLIVPCQYGHLYPYACDLIGFASNTRGPIANAVAALPGAEIVQAGDDGLNITFPPALFSRVAKIVKPHKRSGRGSLSAVERAAATERLKPFRFTQNRGTGKSLPATITA